MVSPAGINFYFIALFLMIIIMNINNQRYFEGYTTFGVRYGIMS